MELPASAILGGDPALLLRRRGCSSYAALHAVMTTQGFLIWDFDGTLATRPGNWTGALCEVVASKYADLGIGPDRLRPHLQSGFPWHTPEIVRRPCSEEEWWEQLLPVLAQALRSGADLPDAEARELAGRVRARYLDPKSWQVFEDVLPVLRELRGRGWKHIVLSNHVPELPRLTEALGLSSFLIDVYCSGRTGAEKPHPKAFEPVFADHPEARAGWMIGDSWRADVQGAMAVGMRSILVREKHPGALLQCDRLYDIAEIVGGA